MDVTWVAKYAKAGWLAPLDAYFTEQEIATLSPLEPVKASCRVLSSAGRSPQTRFAVLAHRSDERTTTHTARAGIHQQNPANQRQVPLAMCGKGVNTKV